jgi:hypothetical protein
MPALVVFNDLIVLRSRRSPAEADAPLVVDADAVPTRPVTLKCFQSIPWRGTEKVQVRWRHPLLPHLHRLLAGRPSSRQMEVLQRSASDPATDVRFDDQFEYFKVVELHLILFNFAYRFGWTEIPLLPHNFSEWFPAI